MRVQTCNLGVKGRYAEIQDELHRAQVMYHVFKEPIISDMRYDALVRESVQLLKEHPDVKEGKLLARPIGDQILSQGKIVRHDFPMLQLNRKHELAGLISWLKILPPDATVDIQVRHTGVEVDLIYIDGKLHRAITAGDGLLGNDVTINMYCVGQAQSSISLEGRTVIRGVVTTKTMVVNKGGEVVGLSGIDLKQHVLTQLHKVLPDDRYTDLIFIAHSIYNPTEQHANWEGWDLVLRYNGFMVPKCYGRGFKAGIYEPGHWEEILDKIQNRISTNSSYISAFKGLVFKVQEMEHRYDLGYTSRFPEWAIAYIPPKGFTNDPQETTSGTVCAD
ncbi:putative DNA ligase [Pseudomonas phage Phabio]|uniref:Putative DNA ligase n=1 Tax=Pseudomonas phage Phabio TaxID=2006668 RepID=A0A1Y0STZ1_9CAUD|nr:NAD-dependent DNA ligase [Pseudomonas phage Phabio]ARV76962.1 putative DNA ligase [Pseudomonas phage Phabio]